MKNQLLKFANFILRPIGAKIVGKRFGSIMMLPAVKRINDHGLEVNSIIDIGASDGSWSDAAMKCFPEALCLAIEPLHERQSALEELKQKRQNFNYVSCVAGEVDVDHVTLNVSSDLDGSTVGGAGMPREVPGKTIDTLVGECNLKGPFLLKFDTHGYELPILNGAMQTLADTSVIIMEVYNFQLTGQSLRFHEMCSHLEKLGFRCYDIADPMLREHDQAFWQVDLFFCREDAMIFSYQEYRELG
jgi:FkbM family methyltransferase